MGFMGKYMEININKMEENSIYDFKFFFILFLKSFVGV